jgi:hypothetical protein
MRHGETELQMVQRHVREGAVHVARQREIVAQFHANGNPTELAEKLLAGFQGMQFEHEAHLERLTVVLPMT